MSSRLATPLLCLGLMSAPLTSGADDVLWARRFDAALASTGVAVWRAGGTVEALAALPGGDLAALVSDEKGQAALVRWGPDGRERSRRAVGLRGKVLSTQVGEDGGLVVATEAEAVRLGPEGRELARKALGLAPRGATAWAPRGDVAAVADGVWVAEPGRLRLVGLGAPDASAALPAPAAGEELDPERTRLFAAAQGGCLVAEWRFGLHAVRGKGEHQPDRPGHRVLALVSRRGEVVASKDLGPARSSLEWLWRESGGPQAWGPGDFGLVRRRYQDGPGLMGAVARPDGGFVLFVSDGQEGQGKDRLVRVEGRLAERWSAPWARERPVAYSPGWARGLLASGERFHYAYDDTGGGERSGVLEYPPGAPVPPTKGRAIGQEAGGGWVVALWGTPEPR